MDPVSIDITFFVPCLNEEKNVTDTLENIAEAVRRVPVRHEILVYDDCSSDNTIDVVEAYSRAHPEQKIRIVKNAVNQGLGHNYRAGASVASGRYYMLVNGDNVEPPAVIAAVLARLGEADIVIPYFGRLDTRPRYRVLISRTFTLIVNALAGTSVHYFNGAVLHRRENVIRYHTGTRGFAYQAEMITGLLRRGASYVEVEVPGQEREHGNTRAFRLSNFVAVTASLWRIARTRFRWHRARTTAG